MRRLMVAFVPFWALACGGAPTEPSGEQHGPEGGVESGESGTLHSPTDTAVETRSGVRLTMSYDAGTETFRGKVVNRRPRSHGFASRSILSNGVELGPTPRMDLTASETWPVELEAGGQTFTSWSVHVELGSRSA